MRSFLALIVMGSALSASATTVPPMTVADLERAADVVVEGVVVDIDARFVGRRIITFYSIQSGRSPDTQTTLVAVPGGVVGDLTQLVPGAPVLALGQHYRLYLGSATGPRLDDVGARARGIVGFWRGVFVVDDVGGVVGLGADGKPLELVRP